jgi:hypothetical protein
MIPPFDIFRVLQDSEPLWLEPASTLEEATARVNELGKFHPGEYLVFSQKTGHKISIVVARQDKLGS